MKVWPEYTIPFYDHSMILLVEPISNPYDIDLTAGIWAVSLVKGMFAIHNTRTLMPP